MSSGDISDATADPGYRRAGRPEERASRAAPGLGTRLFGSTRAGPLSVTEQGGVMLRAVAWKVSGPTLARGVTAERLTLGIPNERRAIAMGEREIGERGEQS